jgi:hypothetical protein
VPTPARPLSAALATVLSPAVLEQLHLGRAAVGVALLARPALLPGLVGADRDAASHLGWALRMLGAREVALGLGAAGAGRAGPRESRRWLQAGLFSDAVDAFAVAAAVGSGRVRPGVGGAVVAVACVAVAAQAGALGRR